MARTGHLIALKLLSRDEGKRPQDQADLVQLIQATDPTEIERAKKAVAEITTRGFHRGRDLSSDLEELLSGRGR